MEFERKASLLDDFSYEAEETDPAKAAGLEHKRKYAPYLESLIRPHMSKIRNAVNYDEPLFDPADFQIDEEDLKEGAMGAGYGLLTHYLDDKLKVGSEGNIGFTGRGFDYTPDDDSRYYLEGRPGGFEIGGNIRF